MPTTLPGRRRDAAAELTDPCPGGDRAAALAILLPPGAAIARRSAAARHGFHLTMPDERSELLPVECVVEAGRAPLRRAGARCYEAVLDGDVELDGTVPVTSALRTCLDTARYEVPPLALAMLDRALRVGLLDPGAALSRLDELPGERGVARARRLLTLADAGAESPGESWLRLRLADAGFPRVCTQIEVPRAGRASLRLDMGWPERRIAVEYDGEEFHGSARQREHDERRRAELRRRGWTVVGVGRGEVLGRSLALEQGVGELLGIEPTTRRRPW
ncbi:hypothetical protein [Kineococcus auxinigenes]|uniref:hypothetical protein n=1 Tax=unclassified Kineococcus TaxID=2621656 RepID=UPI003D7C9F9E